MPDPNPFAAPRSNIGGVPTGRRYPSIELVASGQKLVIYSILVNLASMVARNAPAPILTLIGIGAIVLSGVGVFRLATGLEFSTTGKVLSLLLMVIPVVNLVVLLVLNSKATRALRDAGYSVGLLGASKP